MLYSIKRRVNGFIDFISMVAHILIIGPIALIVFGGLLLCATPILIVLGVLFFCGIKFNLEKVGDCMEASIKRVRKGKEADDA